jgi:type VI secretion system protein ImpL
MKPVFLDANVRSFSLDLEGQQFLYRHGPARLLRAQWPGPNSTGQVRLEFKDDSGARLASTIEGPWAWFRLLDRSELRDRPRDIVQASFGERGRKTTWELRADTVNNPFMSKTISEFRCPGRL